MIVWGINALNHGSSLAVIDGQDLEFYKSDQEQIPRSHIRSAIGRGGPTTIYWYERPWLKKIRQVWAGQYHRAVESSDIPSRYLRDAGLGYAKIKYTSHHASHAAAGYYTAPFDDCAVVVLDAIGEFESATIWHGRDGRMKKLWSRSYPHSLGLFYSAFTDLIGYRPVAEEHRTQELALKGDFRRYVSLVSQYFDGIVTLRTNLHKGVLDWPLEIQDHDREDIASAVQKVFEYQVSLVMTMARKITGSDRLVYMGGCAMNSLANRHVVEPKFSKIWSLGDPGDAGSSIGAVVYHTRQRIRVPQELLVAKHIDIRV
jgi:carbamoyltransferase